MRILVACEESQTVTKAFRALGHEAFSCDIQPCSGGHPEWHYQRDVFEVIDMGWDMMIAFVPCTYMTNAGVRWLYNKDGSHNLERWEKLRQAAEFFNRVYSANIPLIGMENPIMHKYAKELIGVQQSQVIQPWQFGHGETKATCLWLKGLPLLKPTNIVEGREARIHKMPPSPDRAKLRSKTFQGIAEAMAAQWGILPAKVKTIQELLKEPLW